MNKARRNIISKLIEQTEIIKEELENVCSEEQDVLDNIPENLQGTDRYEMCENAVDALSNAVDALDEVIGYMNEAIE